MWPTGSPSAIGTAFGGAVTGGRVPEPMTSLPDAVEEVDDVEVVVLVDVVDWDNLSLNCRSRRSWAWASRMPVPHSWYATKSRISTPAAMQARPMRLSTFATRTTADGTGLLLW